MKDLEVQDVLNNGATLQARTSKLKLTMILARRKPSLENLQVEGYLLYSSKSLITLVFITTACTCVSIVSIQALPAAHDSSAISSKDIPAKKHCQRNIYNHTRILLEPDLHSTIRPGPGADQLLSVGGNR